MKTAQLNTTPKGIAENLIAWLKGPNEHTFQPDEVVYMYAYMMRLAGYCSKDVRLLARALRTANENYEQEFPNTH